jgi:hypothetical protein
MKELLLTIGGLLVGLIGIVTLIVIIIRLFRKSTKNNPINILYLIFGFAATAYFYPAGFEGIIKLLRNFILQSFYILAHLEYIDETESVGVVARVFESKIWYSSILFVAAFILISFLTSWLVEKLKAVKFQSPAQERQNQNVVLKNSILALVLVFALYCSISAIIAIPILNFETNDDSRFSQELKEELDNYSKKDSLLKKSYLLFIKNQRALIEKDTNRNNTIFAIDKIDNYENDIYSTFDDIALLKDRAVARMGVTDNSNIDLKLKLKDKSILSGWYLETRSKQLNYLGFKQQTFNFNFMGIDYLEGGEETEVLKQTFTLLMEKNKPEFKNIPERPTLGSDLGVFTIFAGWLLGLESYPLVIIIGLIGFGLLGAAGSTFIKEKQHNGENNLLVNDLTGVLIKGFTAAIVVFLGVQGSLAVLTSNSGELNAYALFFITFVAAVFSDEAWNWAKNKFWKDFGSEEEGAEKGKGKQ